MLSCSSFPWSLKKGLFCIEGLGYVWKGGTMKTHLHDGTKRSFSEVHPTRCETFVVSYHFKKIFDPHKSADLKGIPIECAIICLFLLTRVLGPQYQAWLLTGMFFGIGCVTHLRKGRKVGAPFFSNQSSLTPNDCRFHADSTTGTPEA